MQALTAQLIQLKTATRQFYAAGQCCDHGVDYEISFRVTQPNIDFKIDSIWCEYTMFPAPQVSAGTLQVETDATGSTYTIHEVLRSGFDEEFESVLDIKPSSRMPAYPEAGAIVFYHSKGLAHRISIAELTELMPIPYP